MKPIFEKINKPADQSFYLEEVIRSYFADQWHFHPEVEILYVSEGYGTKYVGDGITPYHPGDVMIIGSNTPHVLVSNPEYLIPGNNLTSRAHCIQFMTGNVRTFLPYLPELFKINEFLEEAKRGIYFSKGINTKLIGLITELPSLIGMKRLIGLLTILDIMSTNRSYKYLSSPNYKSITLSSEDQDRMEIIYQYVIQNYSDKIYLEEVASLVHLTPHSFCRFFKSRTSKVFSTFVNEVRIGNACRMLIENELTVSQICYATGFNYLSNFNKQFRKLKGMTPSEFVSKYKNANIEMEGFDDLDVRGS